MIALVKMMLSVIVPPQPELLDHPVTSIADLVLIRSVPTLICKWNVLKCKFYIKKKYNYRDILWRYLVLFAGLRIRIRIRVYQKGRIRICKSQRNIRVTWIFLVKSSVNDILYILESYWPCNWEWKYHCPPAPNPA